MFRIERYTPMRRTAWNEYVAKARNATFLFNRDYMDYHSDRFQDHSLLFFLKDKLHSILPGHEKADVYCSHGGLTYGGLIMDMDVTAADVVKLFHELNEYLRAQGFRRVVYKPVPWVYHRVPSEEDLYPLFWECNARLTSRDLGTAIAIQQHIRWRRLRRRGLKRAEEAGVTVQRSNCLSDFWPVLTENLMTRHGVAPVHSLQEMELLTERFPQNILLYTATLEDQVLGGLILYLTPNALHAQYSSATPQGKELGAMDAIYDYILNHEFPDYPFLDFGRSTEGDGSVLNEQLIQQKEGFGGRAVCYDVYEWEL